MGLKMLHSHECHPEKYDNKPRCRALLKPDTMLHHKIGTRDGDGPV